MNERKSKYENERKRWQDELDEHKQSHDKELDELRDKLRKQRTADNSNNNQRVEQDWQDKLDQQQANFDKLLKSKSKELDTLRAAIQENEAKVRISCSFEC